MTTANAHTARLMRVQLVALGLAVDEVETGRCSVEERQRLARGLDTLAVALRAGHAPVVLEAEHTACTPRATGILEFGVIL